MLFPTIERMAQTPQGKVMTPVLCQLRYLGYLPLFLLSLLPDSLKYSLIKLVLSGIHSLDLSVIRPTVSLLNGDCAGWYNCCCCFCVQKNPALLSTHSTVFRSE